MQTADLVFGDFSRAIDEMMKLEKKEFLIGLLRDLVLADSEGLIPTGEVLSPAQERFWEPMGGRCLDKSKFTELMAKLGSIPSTSH